MNYKLYAILIIILFAPFAALSADINVTDDDIQAGQQVTWTSDNVYHLDGFVFVEDGAVLNIEAGTVIKGMPGQGANASALVIARGGKIMAEGTANDPIIFTAEADDTNDPNDLPAGTRGLWGGLIILGNATTNLEGGEGHIEGIPSTEERGSYGGGNNPDDADNSGVLRYVSVRHGGTDLGDGDEINGVTFGAVGSGTTVEHVEVYANNDDGFEWFGGTVSCKYLVAAFCKDDAFDLDQGWQGKGQFFFAIQDTVKAGDRAGEHDGHDDVVGAQPTSMPIIYNATYIGAGANAYPKYENMVFKIRQNSSPTYKNSIFYDFPGTSSGVIIDVEDKDDPDSRDRMEAGDLVFANNLWYEFGVGSTSWAELTKSDQGYVQTHMEANNNWIEDPMLRGVGRLFNKTKDNILDPRPKAGSPAMSKAKATYDNKFYDDVDYLGAFGPNNYWIGNWTMLYQSGIARPIEVGNDVQVFDSDIKSGQTYNWTRNNTYHLNGFVFVEDGAVLNIEAGTVIKGMPGQGANASALVIARGGKIMAEGTANDPIIFTAEADDTNDPNDLPAGTRGLWGGLIILGNATTNLEGGEGHIEGIPSTEERGSYGGGNNPDDADNSGVLRYVSVRHGGTDLGDGDEINGVTFGAVGSGTTVEHVEVYANNDDGFEWFGGTVSCKYLVAAFCKDDAFDLDQGWQGKGQFFFAIQDTVKAGDRAGEHDGHDDVVGAQPTSMPIIYNATYIGAGANAYPKYENMVFKIRQNSSPTYKNSIFYDFPGTSSGVIIDVEDKDDPDSRDRMEAGDLVFANNLWYEFGVGSTSWAELTKSDQGYVQTHMKANNNWLQNPQIRGVGRLFNQTENNVLDPRPAPDGPAFTNDKADLPAGGFFTQVNHIGAFGDDMWLSGWTFLSKSGLAGEVQSVEEFGAIAGDGDKMIKSYPNPFTGSTKIQFFVSNYSDVNITVYNSMGQAIETLIDKTLEANVYEFTWTPEDLPAGMYMLKMQSGDQITTHKLIIE